MRPWLYRIVHNAAVNAMRGPAEAIGELTEAVQARPRSPASRTSQRTIAVREALAEVAALPQMQRQAIFLTAVDGQSHDEVASVLGISEGALRGLLYRARATLRSAAAALTPPPLLEWASGSTRAAAPTAERLAELTAGGGAAGLAGVLLKGAVVTVTAGAVATGAGVVAGHKHGAVSRHHRVAAAAPLVALPGSDENRISRSGISGSASPIVLLAEHQPTHEGRREGGHHGARTTMRGAHRTGERARGGSPVDADGREQTRGRAGSGDGSGQDGGRHDLDTSDDRRGSSAAPSAHGGLAQRERPEPSAEDRGTGGSSGSGRDGSDVAAAPSEQTHGGQRSSSNSGDEASAVAGSGLDSTPSFGPPGGGGTAGKERTNGSSGGPSGDGGSGSDS